MTRRHVGGVLTRLRHSAPVFVVIILTAALAVLIYMLVSAGRQREEALAYQQQSFEVVNLARALDGSIAESEASLARFVIGLDKETGQLFSSQWRTAALQLRRLTYLTRNDPQQKALVKQLQSAFDERNALFTDVAVRASYDQKLVALTHFYQAGRDPSRAQVIALLDKIITNEQATLQRRMDRVEASENASATLFNTYAAFGFFTVVAGLLMAWSASAAMAEQRHASSIADDEMARAIQLEEAVRNRTKELREANEALRSEAAERAEAEEKLRQVQKMEAVGQLTGGIAHDFNNMLAVVVGGLELAKRKLRQEPRTAEYHLDNAMEGANRASALTRRLLAFARSEPLLPQAVVADELIAGMVDLIDRTIGEQIRIEVDAQAGDWSVWADRHQLENAILNLAVNARDAMDGRGTLTLMTQCATLKPDEIGECAGGEYIAISVSDTGIGMSPEIVERVFEPFFTTKPVGKGTGLGLSQIFGFVRQSRGDIVIHSEPGKGTRVTLYLPRSTSGEAEGTQSLPVRAAPELSVAASSYRVLVVEDDPRVLSASVAALTELGHDPSPCPRAEDAAAIIRERPDFDLILSDVLMPEMTGPEMVAHLREIGVEIPVLFVTGFAGDVEDVELTGHEVLRKPFTMAALASAVERACARPASEWPPLQAGAARG